MITMTTMIEFNKEYKLTLRVQGMAKANEYFQRTKKFMINKYNISEDMFRQLWNGANSIVGEIK